MKSLQPVTVVSWVVAVATGLIATPLRLDAANVAPGRPHIVVIVADDLRADVMSAYGGPVQTPHLEQLAARGCRFVRASCGYPICHVSRTELLSGRSVVAEAAAGKAIPFKPEWALWPQTMRQAGWHTVHLGKWHVEGSPWTRGYVETGALFSGGGASGQPLTNPRSATQRPVTGYVGWTFKSNENKPLPEFGIGLTPQTDVRIADGAIDTLRKASSQPLFLHVNFTAPHDPLHWPLGSENRFRSEVVVLPKSFCAEHPFDHGSITGRDETIVPAPRTADDVQRERAVYFGLVENLDVQVGRIMQALEDDDRLQDTLVIFTSDQGLALGSHGLMGKQNQYEHTVNVPLILAGPGIPAGKRIDAQCALRDLFPTVCELTGLSLPGSVQGKSLMPVLRGETSEVHDAVFGYFTQTQRMLRTPDGWKLIWYPKANRTQLFDVAHDADELHDLSAEPAHGERMQQMLQKLQAWLRERGDSW
jgi:arylsulfatase A-like enzyme